MRAFAAAILEIAKADGAIEVWLTPNETYITYADETLTVFTNSEEMKLALDHYLLTGQLPQDYAFRLIPRQKDEAAP